MKKKITSLAILSIISSFAFAAYPEKPITLIIPFAKGGSTDLMTRIVVDPLAKELGQPIIVENISTQSTGSAVLDVTKAEPDGYTLVASTVSTTATGPAYNSNIGYNPITDLTHIGGFAITPNVILVNSKFPAKNFQEFEEVLKKSRGSYSYASSGNGGLSHLILETYKGLSKNSMTHIPYRGSGPALKYTADNKSDVILDNYPTTKPYIASGQLIPIAVASRNRLPDLPNVKTMAELGYPEANRVAYYGISGPAQMNKDTVKKINDALRTVLAKPEIKKQIEETGSFVYSSTPEEFTNQIKNELSAYQSIIKTQKLSPN